MHELLLSHKEHLLELEKRCSTSKEHGGKIAVIFRYLKQTEQRQQETALLAEIGCGRGKNPIGFKAVRE